MTSANASEGARTPVVGLWRAVGADLAHANEHAGAFSGARRLSLARRASLLVSPPFLCVLIYRLSHALHQHRRTTLAHLVARFNYLIHKASIAPSSEIGPGFYLAHPVGVVFQGHAGRRLTLFGRAAVMPGELRDWSGAIPDDAPRLGDNVTVGGAALLRGPVSVASGTLVRACSVATRRSSKSPEAAATDTLVSPTPTATLLLSVVIVNWKVPNLLRECLRSIAAEMELSPAEYEVLVVDNDSEDGSVRMLQDEFPAVRVIANRENVGFARGNNDALPHCRGRYLLLLNPDTLVLDHALDRMVAYMEAHPRVGVLGCRLVNTDGSFQRWTGGALPTLSNAAGHFLLLGRLLPATLTGPGLFLTRDVHTDLEVDWVSAACMAVRRHAVGDRIFDPAFFMYGEDVELCDRLRHAGFLVIYTPSVSIVHHHGASMRQQSGSVTLSGLKGLRTHFASRHGRLSLRCYDLITVTGFMLRWGMFTLLSVARPGRGYSRRADSSRKYLAQAMRIMAGE